MTIENTRDYLQALSDRWHDSEVGFGVARPGGDVFQFMSTEENDSFMGEAVGAIERYMLCNEPIIDADDRDMPTMCDVDAYQVMEFVDEILENWGLYGA